MAIYHFNLKLVRRHEGKSAVEVAAYVARRKIECPATGLVFDHSDLADDLVRVELVGCDLPAEEYFARAELAELRRKAVVARTIVVALPCELSEAENWTLLRSYAEAISERLGAPVLAAYHADQNPETPMEERNDHGHLEIPTRVFDAKTGEFGKKTRELDCPDTGSVVISKLRKDWEERVNAVLPPWAAQVSCAPLRKTKPGHIPAKHMGRYATDAERMNRSTATGEYNVLVALHNDLVDEISVEERELAEMVARHREMTSPSVEMVPVSREPRFIATPPVRPTEQVRPVPLETSGRSMPQSESDIQRPTLRHKEPVEVHSGSEFETFEFGQWQSPVRSVAGVILPLDLGRLSGNRGETMAAASLPEVREIVPALRPVIEAQLTQSDSAESHERPTVCDPAVEIQQAVPGNKGTLVSTSSPAGWKPSVADHEAPSSAEIDAASNDSENRDQSVRGGNLLLDSSAIAWTWPQAGLAANSDTVAEDETVEEPSDEELQAQQQEDADVEKLENEIRDPLAIDDLEASLLRQCLAIRARRKEPETKESAELSAADVAMALPGAGALEAELLDDIENPMPYDELQAMVQRDCEAAGQRQNSTPSLH